MTGHSTSNPNLYAKRIDVRTTRLLVVLIHPPSGSAPEIAVVSAQRARGGLRGLAAAGLALDQGDLVVSDHPNNIILREAGPVSRHRAQSFFQRVL